MQIVIDIPEQVYKHGTLGLYFDCYSMRLHDTILNGTPIPDNATNGDVINKMFDAETAADIQVNSTEYWLNATYQKGGK